VGGGFTTSFSGRGVEWQWGVGVNVGVGVFFGNVGVTMLGGQGGHPRGNVLFPGQNRRMGRGGHRVRGGGFGGGGCRVDTCGFFFCVKGLYSGGGKG